MKCINMEKVIWNRADLRWSPSGWSLEIMWTLWASVFLTEMGVTAPSSSGGMRITGNDAGAQYTVPTPHLSFERW